MFEPVTLPTAISFEPLRAAVTLTASSGREVPKATMVRPITSGDTPSFFATPEAESTKTSAPFTSSKKPSRVRNAFHKICIYNFLSFQRICPAV